MNLVGYYAISIAVTFVGTISGFVVSSKIKSILENIVILDDWVCEERETLDYG